MGPSKERPSIETSRWIGNCRLFLAVSLFLVLFLFPFTSPSQAHDAITLQLRWKHGFQFAGYYAAKEKGFYKSKNLDVSFLEGGRFSKSDVVINGQAHYGIENSGLLINRTEGQPVVVLASIFQHSPHVLFARKDHGIKSIHDLVGKRLWIDLTPRTADIQAMFLNEGISLDHLVAVEDNQKQPDYTDETLSAFGGYLTNEAYQFRLLAVPYIVINPRTYGIDFYGDSLFTSQDEVNKHPKRTEAFLRASLKGWAYAFENMEEMIEIVHTRYAPDRSIDHLQFEAQQIRALVHPHLIEIGHMNPQRWKAIAETYAKLGIVDTAEVPEGFIYNPLEKKAKSLTNTRRLLLAVSAILAAALGIFFYSNRGMRRVLKKRNRKLTENRKLYQTVFHSATDAIIIADAKTGMLVDANPKAEDLLGRSVEDLRQLHQTDLHPPEQSQCCNIAFHEAVDTDGVYIHEALMVKKDGSTVPVEVSSGGTVRVEGQTLHFGLFRDISKRKEAEETMRRISDQNQMILDAAGDGIFGVDARGQVTFINPMAANLLGYQPDEAIGQFYGVFLENGDAKETCPVYQSYHAGIATHTAERTFRRKSGERLVVEITSTPLRQNGDLLGAVATFRDLTERKQLEIDRRQLEDRKQQVQKMEALGTLAGGVAHDFNNILVPILGYAEILKSQFPEKTSNGEAANEIYLAARRAKELISQILAFSRQSEVSAKPVKIQLIVKEVMRLVRPSLPTEIDIQTRISPNVGYVLCDPVQIHQMTMNLITNAYHAMEETGGELIVSVDEVDHAFVDRVAVDVNGIMNRFVRIVVKDTGKGIPYDIQNKVFDPYFTTKEKGKGTGLGLSLVHGIAREIGGGVHLESTPGIGTAVSLFLPRTTRSENEEPDATIAPNADSGASILVVDDNEQVLRFLNRLLSTMGHRVTGHTSSVEALAAFQHDPDNFDLVITDFHMPNVNGIDLSKRIKTLRPDIRILLCTGFSNRISESGIDHLPVDGLLLKPLLPKDITKQITALLERPKSTSETHRLS